MTDYIHVEITGTDQGIPQGQCSYKPQSQIVACTLDDMKFITEVKFIMNISYDWL